MNELTKVDQNQMVTATPQEVVESGVIAAKTLMGIVEQNKWAIPMQGKKYLVFEAWQTLARFYNYTVKTKETKYVEYGSVKGFEAIVEVLDKDGRVVGGAEASCLNDEPNWGSHTDKYGKTVPAKPMFSLKAMAQTRAAGRALRQLLSFVAVLAGYMPTNAEEMPDEFSKATNNEKITSPQMAKLGVLANKELGQSNLWLSQVITKAFPGKKTLPELTKNEASALIQKLEEHAKKVNAQYEQDKAGTTDALDLTPEQEGEITG